MYGGIFLVFSYTRNGLFFAPLFLLLGAAGLRWSRRISAAGFALSLLGMSLEAFWLRVLDWPRHDSMYLLLPLCMVFLFSLLLGENRGEDKWARRVSLLVYLLHPWSIVLVRGGAEAAGLEGIFVQNSLGHFCAVLALTVGMALALDGLRPIRPDPKSRAWAEVDLEALARNARTLESTLSSECRLMAVVKADGYGHGAVPAARRLWRGGGSGLRRGLPVRGHFLAEARGPGDHPHPGLYSAPGGAPAPAGGSSPRRWPTRPMDGPWPSRESRSRSTWPWTRGCTGWGSRRRTGRPSCGCTG